MRTPKGEDGQEEEGGGGMSGSGGGGGGAGGGASLFSTVAEGVPDSVVLKIGISGLPGVFVREYLDSYVYIYIYIYI